MSLNFLLTLLHTYIHKGKEFGCLNRLHPSTNYKSCFARIIIFDRVMVGPGDKAALTNVSDGRGGLDGDPVWLFSHLERGW